MRLCKDERNSIKIKKEMFLRKLARGRCWGGLPGERGAGGIKYLGPGRDLHLFFIDCVHPVDPSSASFFLEAEVEASASLWEDVALETETVMSLMLQMFERGGAIPC